MKSDLKLFIENQGWLYESSAYIFKLCFTPWTLAVNSHD